MSVISIVDDEIRMDSQMDENGFGKTSYNTIVTQKGVLATSSLSGQFSYDFELSDWTFSDIKAYPLEGTAKNNVFYCARNIFSSGAKTLLSIMNEAEGENASEEAKKLFFEAGIAVITLLTKAAVEKTPLPLNGAGGIIVDKTSDKIQLLFLPEDLYKYSSGALNPEEYVLEQGYWVNTTLYDLPAICYTRGVIAYKLLTGKFPYAAVDVTERNADIMDRNFLPVDLCLGGVNPQLSKAINKALQLNSNQVSIPGKKQRGKASEDLTPVPEFPVELLISEYKTPHTSIDTDASLQEKANLYMKTKQSKIKTSRNLRRNTSSIIITLIIIAVAGMILGSFINSNMNEYSSKGLTSAQTVEAFYYAVNEKDSVLMTNISSSKKTSRFADAIGQVYVIGKSRRTYNAQDQGFMKPAAYLLFMTDNERSQNAGCYGVTNLSIDGKISDLNPPMHLRKEKVEPLTTENGKTISNGDTTKYTVTYYMLRTEDTDNHLIIEKKVDSLVLTYKKDRWIITDYDSAEFEIEVNNYEFRTEYFANLLINDMDVKKTVSQMKEKYEWLPITAVIENEEKVQAELAKDPFPSMY